MLAECFEIRTVFVKLFAFVFELPLLRLQDLLLSVEDLLFGPIKLVRVLY